MKTEGRNAVLELLKTGKNIDKLLIEKGAQGSASMIFAEARKRNIRVQFVDRKVLDKESETRRHQGVIAFTTDYEYFDLEDMIAEKKSEKGGFIVLCDGIDYEKGCFVGRAYFNAPDIDGKVYFNAANATQGEYYKVKINRNDAYDLYGYTEDYEGD